MGYHFQGSQLRGGSGQTSSSPQPRSVEAIEQPDIHKEVYYDDKLSIYKTEFEKRDRTGARKQERKSIASTVVSAASHCHPIFVSEDCLLTCN